MTFWRPVAAALLALGLVLPVAAADLIGGYAVPGQCVFAEQSQLASLPDDEIELRVISYYDEADDALDSPAVLESRSPAFLWANETKFQCGKAIGYMKGGYLDEDSVQKCDCSHNRLVRFR
jgi:hypothetical protein